MRLLFTPLILRRITLVTAAFLIFTAIYFVSSQLLGLKTADSAATDNVSGWGWAGNVTSSVSLNNCNPVCGGSSYGANVDASGNLSGYAWIDNFGWISFDRAVTNNPPAVPFNGGAGAIARVNLLNGNVTGWARVLSGCQNTAGTPAVSCASSAAGANAGGWDGWISLAGANYSTNYAGGKLSGFAWGGSDMIGWIDFGVAAAVPAPVITFSASPTSVVSGGNSTLTWSTTDATSCVASGAWSGARVVASSEPVNNILPPQTYTLTCTGPTGLTASSSLTITLSLPPPSGTLTVSTCDIPFNGNSCPSAVTWSSSNFVGGTSVRQGGIQFSAAPAGGPVNKTVNYGNNTFTLVDTGSGVVKTQSVNILCLTGSTWISGSCVPDVPAPITAPDVSISANPTLIRSGNTSTVIVSVDSTYKVTCTIKGANNADDTVNHLGAAGVISYSIPTKALTSTQVVSIECVYTDYPGLTKNDETRIKVIPIVQEI